MSEGDFEEPYQRYVEHFLAEVLPRMRNTAVVAAFLPEPTQAHNVQQATELGTAVMLDKPIIMVVEPGSKIPAKVALVADHIVEGEIGTAEGRASLRARLAPIIAMYR